MSETGSDGWNCEWERIKEREGGRALIIVDNGQLTWAGSAGCGE